MCACVCRLYDVLISLQRSDLPQVRSMARWFAMQLSLARKYLLVCNLVLSQPEIVILEGGEALQEALRSRLAFGWLLFSCALGLFCSASLFLACLVTPP